MPANINDNARGDENLDLETYKLFERYMLSCMDDSAHDKEHVYRVLYVALDIASHEEDVNYDVLICACLFMTLPAGA